MAKPSNTTSPSSNSNSSANGARPSSGGAVSDFVREAVREKVTREWTALAQKRAGLEALARVRAALDALAGDLDHSVAALASLAEPASLGGRVKKLRKVVDDARAIGLELETGIGGADQRAKLDETRASITLAWREAGLDEADLESIGKAAPPAVAPSAPAEPEAAADAIEPADAN